MQKPRFTAALLIIALGIFPSERDRKVIAQDAAPNQHIVLLKNGQVIKGIATESSSEMSIQTPQGSRLVIAREDVDTVCESMIQAYWLKSAQVKASDLSGQQQLFHWCLSHKLLVQAQNQIDILSLMPIKATEIEFLHRQLSVAFSQRDYRQATKNDEQVAKLTKQTSDVASLDVDNSVAPAKSSFANSAFRPLPVFYGVESSKATDPFDSTKPPPVPANLAQAAFEPKVAQVGFIEAVSASTTPFVESVKPKVDARASIEELERLTKTLPRPAVAMFKRKIEPLLVRSCYAEGCHSSNDAVMQLTHSGKGRPIPRRLSQRNLYTIIKQTDPNEPLASPLLAAAMTSHGGLEEPIIKSSTKQFNNLATWLIMISNKPNSIHQMPERDTATQPIAEKLPSPAPLDSQLEKKVIGVDRDDGASNDPHDPDIFNRRFGNRESDR